MGMMHNVTARLNSSFFFGVTLLGILAGINAFTAFLIEQPSTSTLGSFKVNKFYGSGRFKWDEAELSFDIEADLKDVFNWNVKLLYVWIEADYSTSDRHRNQIVVWDKLIWRDQYDADNGKLRLKSEKAKYIMKTKDYDLRSTEVVFRLRWEVTPIVGLTYKLEGGKAKLTFPGSYK
jgi:signal peptidase complex subunit 3